MAAAAMLARRIRTSLLGNTTAAAQRIRNSAIGSSTAEGSRLLMAQDLLRRLPHKEEVMVLSSDIPLFRRLQFFLYNQGFLQTRRVFGLTQPAYVRLPHRPICSSSSSKNVRFLHLLRSHLFFFPSGVSQEYSPQAAFGKTSTDEEIRKSAVLWLGCI